MCTLILSCLISSNHFTSANRGLANNDAKSVKEFYIRISLLEIRNRQIAKEYQILSTSLAVFGMIDFIS